MPWAKGQSGNPKGRAAEKSFADALRLEIKAAGDDHAILRAIAKKLLEKAEGGDMQAINCLANRLDGKPQQAVEMIGDVPHYVIRAPEPCSTVEEWEIKYGHGYGKSMKP